MNYPDFLEKAFEENYSTNSDETTLNFHKISIGKININTGKIITSDPFAFSNNKPFTKDFPIGKFPVELAIADIDADERIGFARILFSDAKPVRWEFALLEGQDSNNLEPGEIFGYGVDSGTGSFMDSSGYNEFSRKYDEDEEYYNVVFKEIDKTYKHTRSWTLWEANGNNVAFFSSGYGDGVYQTYIGYDQEGNISRLVTDFGLIEWN